MLFRLCSQHLPTTPTVIGDIITKLCLQRCKVLCSVQLKSTSTQKRIQKKMGNMKSEKKPLLQDVIDNVGGCAVIDGGFATQLERHGASINDPLWSALCLIKDPHLIKQVFLSPSFLPLFLIHIHNPGFCFACLCDE